MTTLEKYFYASWMFVLSNSHEGKTYHIIASLYDIDKAIGTKDVKEWRWEDIVPEQYHELFLHIATALFTIFHDASKSSTIW